MKKKAVVSDDAIVLGKLRGVSTTPTGISMRKASCHKAFLHVLSEPHLRHDTLGLSFVMLETLFSAIMQRSP
jgi:hypothetical protein